MKEMNQLSRIAPASQTSEQVRQDLERSRARVAASVDALRDDLKLGVSKITASASEVRQEIKRSAAALKRGMNWKLWVARNPWGFVAGGLALGLLLGSRRRS